MGLSGWTKLGRDYLELGGFNTTSVSFILPLRDMSYHDYQPHTRAVVFCITVTEMSMPAILQQCHLFGLMVESHCVHKSYSSSNDLKKILVSDWLGCIKIIEIHAQYSSN